MKKEIYIGVIIGVMTALVVEFGKEVYFNNQLERNNKEHYCNLLNSINNDIYMRTKQGLIAAKSQGKILGRPKGSGNKKGRGLDPFREQIQKYIEMGLSINAIMKIINNQLENPFS